MTSLPSAESVNLKSHRSSHALANIISNRIRAAMPRPADVATLTAFLLADAASLWGMQNKLIARAPFSSLSLCDIAMSWETADRQSNRVTPDAADRPDLTLLNRSRVACHRLLETHM